MLLRGFLIYSGSPEACWPELFSRSSLTAPNEYVLIEPFIGWPLDYYIASKCVGWDPHFIMRFSISIGVG